MKILIPIVGNEKNDNGSAYIKSLHEIERKTVLQHVYESLAVIDGAEFIVVLKKEDVARYHLDSMIRLLIPNVKMVIADGPTKGSACSCLLAIDEIDEDEALLVVGSDQLVNVNLQTVIDEFVKRDYDGGIVIFDDIHPRWSYVKLDENNYVVEAAEKRPISRNATTGFYYFKKGKDFVVSVEQMIKKNAHVNGNYYVCPAYNEMVLAHKKVGVYKISKKDYFNFNHQNGLEDYERYLKSKHEES